MMRRPNAWHPRMAACSVRNVFGPLNARRFVRYAITRSRVHCRLPWIWNVRGVIVHPRWVREFIGGIAGCDHEASGAGRSSSHKKKRAQRCGAYPLSVGALRATRGVARI